MDTEARRAMDGIELAIRRVSFRLKKQVPWDMAVTEALDELADEIGSIAAGEHYTQPKVSSTVSNGERQ